MVEIQPLGGFLAVDDAGFIVNETSLEYIVAPWSYAVSAVIEAYRKHCGPYLHSVYVRGSVARGSAIIGISDVDTFAVVARDPRDIDLEWREAFLAGAAQRFPFATTIELNVYPIDRVLNSGRFARLRFALKTQSVCVYGGDLSVGLPNVRANRDAVFYAHTLTRDIERTRRELAEGGDTRAAGTWGLKCLIRAGFELVLEAEGRYARDLYPCYAAFCRHYPSEGVAMRRALDLVLNPTDDPHEYLVILEQLGAWLVQEAKGKLERLSPQ
jgi:hypothetical protein